MQFSDVLVAFLATSLRLISANSIVFVSKDKTDRTVHFYPGLGKKTGWPIKPLLVKGKDTKHVDIPAEWFGTFQTTLDPKTKWEFFGTQGIVAFNETKTFYTVSAASNITDNTSIRLLYPHSEKDDKNKSGRKHFPCDKASNDYEKVDLKSTEGKDLICEIGGK
jgi:hypothetical protein